MKRASDLGSQTPCFQANTQIRTGDLILTKDVLYQLSHISIGGSNRLAAQRVILYQNQSDLSIPFLKFYFFFFGLKFFEKGCGEKLFLKKFFPTNLPFILKINLSGDAVVHNADEGLAAVENQLVTIAVFEVNRRGFRFA